MNILITSAGQRVSLIRHFQKELKSRFKNAKVFAVDKAPNLSPACQIADQSYIVKAVTDENYISDLMEICVKHKIVMVIPTIDTELIILASNRHLFEASGIFIIVSDLDFIRVCRDKRKTKALFESYSINTPKNINKKDLSFPLFIKPYDGSLSSDTFRINSSADLTDFHLNNEKLIFMEYFDKNDFDEYTVDMYYDKQSKLKCVVPRKRLFVRAGEVNKAVTIKNQLITLLTEKLMFLNGAKGCINIQLFLSKNDSTAFGIEINPRFGGGYPLSYHAGANFPKWLIDEYITNKEIDFFTDWEDKLLMLRYDDEVFVHGYNY